LDESKRDKTIDRIMKKVHNLDDVCVSIYLALSLRGQLRYNELFRTVNRLNPNQDSGKPFISKPTFAEHINHLLKHKLITRIEKGKQNTILSLSKHELVILNEIMSASFDSEYFEDFFKKYPEFEIIDSKQYYAKLSQDKLKEEVSRDISLILKTILSTLKAVVNHDLKSKIQDNADFWNFVGDPLYRMLEKGIAEKCRESVDYRTAFFEEVELILKKKKVFNDVLED